MTNSFDIHPSSKLKKLYQIKSYQGAEPQSAPILFVGRDPNWGFDIEDQDIFQSVIEYLSDGVNFWSKYGVHHPFLLPGYNGDGKRYHRMFANLQFPTSMADKISFVELIGLPTTGMAGKNRKQFQNILLSDENRKNLIELDELFKNNRKKIFIAKGLLKEFRFINIKTGLFKFLANIYLTDYPRQQLVRIEHFYFHTHFSDAISNDMIEQVKLEINFQ